MRFRKKSSGFSVTELLIAIVILGILASISVVGYSSYQRNFQKKAIEHDLRLAAAAMESEKNFGAGYPESLPGSFEPGGEVEITYASGDLTSFCLFGVYKDSELSMYITNDGTVNEGVCPDF